MCIVYFTHLQCWYKKVGVKLDTRSQSYPISHIWIMISNFCHAWTELDQGAPSASDCCKYLISRDTYSGFALRQSFIFCGIVFRWILVCGGHLYFAASSICCLGALSLSALGKCLQSWEESNLRRPRPRPVLIVSTNSLLLHILLFSIIAYIVNCINQFSVTAYIVYSILHGKLNFTYFCTLHCSTIGLQTQW